MISLFSDFTKKEKICFFHPFSEESEEPHKTDFVKKDMVCWRHQKTAEKKYRKELQEIRQSNYFVPRLFPSGVWFHMSESAGNCSSGIPEELQISEYKEIPLTFLFRNVPNLKKSVRNSQWKHDFFAQIFPPQIHDT